MIEQIENINNRLSALIERSAKILIKIEGDKPETATDSPYYSDSILDQLSCSERLLNLLENNISRTMDIFYPPKLNLPNINYAEPTQRYT